MMMIMMIIDYGLKHVYNIPNKILPTGSIRPLSHSLFSILAGSVKISFKFRLVVSYSAEVQLTFTAYFSAELNLLTTFESFMHVFPCTNFSTVLLCSEVE